MGLGDFRLSGFKRLPISKFQQASSFENLAGSYLQRGWWSWHSSLRAKCPTPSPTHLCFSPALLPGNLSSYPNFCSGEKKYYCFFVFPGCYWKLRMIAKQSLVHYCLRGSLRMRRGKMMLLLMLVWRNYSPLNDVI